MSDPQSIAKNASIIRGLTEANGPLISLSVGVSEYSNNTHLSALRVCANDAERVRNAFLDVSQLNGDKGRTALLNTKTADKPTKNTIIGKLRTLSQLATPDDRLLYFHSGHAVRIGDELFLVPSDAYSSDEPDALLSVAKVKEILSASEAKQKIIVLDACYTGPNTAEFKAIPAEVSIAFVKKYVAETLGIALLSSSAENQKSTTQSPDSNLSLFTYYFLRALYGEPDALDQNKHLTLYSLHSYLSSRVDRRARSYHTRQRPGLETDNNGDFFLGDFGASPIELQGLQLDQHPIDSLLFADSDSVQVKEILTRMRSTVHLREDQIEYAANKALPEYVRAEFGRMSADLASSLGFGLTEVTVDDNFLFFPDGDLSVKYEANGKSSGSLVHETSLRGSFIEQPNRIGKVLTIFRMYPTEITFKINGSLNLERMRSGLPAGGWKIISSLSEEVQASRAGYSLRASKNELTLSGFTPKELFGDEADSGKTSLVAGVLGLLGK